MRSSILFAAPLVAAAYAQTSSEANGTVRELLYIPPHIDVF
jgi:hypothetical protein